MATTTTVTPLGKVSVTPRGDWVRDTIYYSLDIVNHNGSSYICTIENNTNEPDTTTASNGWQLLAQGSYGSEYYSDREPSGIQNGSYWCQPY